MTTTTKALAALALRLLLLVGLAVQPAAMLSAGGAPVHALEMGAPGGCDACDHQVQAGQCVAACVATSAILVVASPVSLRRPAVHWPLADANAHGLDPPPELAPPRV